LDELFRRRTVVAAVFLVGGLIVLALGARSPGNAIFAEWFMFRSVALPLALASVVMALVEWRFHRPTVGAFVVAGAWTAGGVLLCAPIPGSWFNSAWRLQSFGGLLVAAGVLLCYGSVAAFRSQVHRRPTPLRFRVLQAIGYLPVATFLVVLGLVAARVIPPLWDGYSAVMGLPGDFRLLAALGGSAVLLRGLLQFGFELGSASGEVVQREDAADEGAAT
jgi:uncharacterized membrane protein YhdT